MNGGERGAPPEPRVWSGLAIALPGGTLVGPEISLLLVQTLDRYARNDGIALPPHLVYVRKMLLLGGSQANSGHADARNRTESAESPTWTTDEQWVTASDAAKLLGCSREHVGRLSRSGALGATRLVRGKRLVERVKVAALAADRRTA